MNNPKKILITYGDYEWKNAKRRIKREAQELHFFDKVIAYSPKNLSKEVKQSQLYQYKKGGGYWIWKPYIIRKTIERYPNATIFYCDAGCTLLNSPKWEELYEKSQNKQVILCRYDDDGVCLSWQKYFGCSSPKAKHWTKSETLGFFNNQFGIGEWVETNIILAGFIVMRGTNPLLDEWLTLSTDHPELIKDPETGENDNNDMIQHRHDQIILTALAWKHRNNEKVDVLAERYVNDDERPIVASRLKYCPGRIKRALYPIVHTLTGERTYQRIKNLFRKSYNE